MSFPPVEGLDITRHLISDLEAIAHSDAIKFYPNGNIGEYSAQDLLQIKEILAQYRSIPKRNGSYARDEEKYEQKKFGESAF